MKSIGRFFALILIIALALLIAPAILEAIVFLFIAFLQIMITIMVIGWLVAMVQRALGISDDEQFTYSYA